MVPHIEHPQFDQPIDPSLVHEVIQVGFADARADSCDDFVSHTVFNALHCFVEHSCTATALVADNFAALNAHQRCDVPTPAQLCRHMVGDEVPVGEDLEIAIGMSAEDLQDVSVHEGFSTDDAKEVVTLLIGFANNSGQRFEFNLFLFGSHVDPTTLAAEVATVDDRDVEKRRKELATCQSPFVLLNRPGAFEAKIPGQLPEQPLIGFGQ